MVKKGTVITAVLGAVVLAVGGYLVYDRFFRGDEQKQEESTKSSTSKGVDNFGSYPVKSVFLDYTGSSYFPDSMSIPKGTPKNIASLVDQCVDGAKVYHGSTGGTLGDFPKTDVAKECRRYIDDKLDFSGCSAKKSGALYCNGKPVRKQDSFVLRYR